MFDFGSKTYIMGILNLTPDSFSDGGEYFQKDEAVERAKKMVAQGADIIDIGAESTRPGSEKVSAAEELRRLTPVLNKLVAEIGVPISVDTYKAEVAKEVLGLGVDIINDVRGLQWDEDMAQVIAEYDVPVVAMYNGRFCNDRGDIIGSIKNFLRKSIDLAKGAGVKEKNIILDPGIGFGISAEESMEIVRRLSELKGLGHPLLLGTSRKSMLGEILDLPPKERVEGTVATTVMGIMHGVDIVRVHDIKENLRAAQVTDAIFRK
ncbi:dihydropteroate synthase [Natroniella sp. ANB-PHB2]|uniref:dihydropteroate synthase n=1 Tax=Natroniella sp. ANB-PHB2 TaxID=3384444 RepID=UPI0038D4B358